MSQNVPTRLRLISGDSELAGGSKFAGFDDSQSTGVDPVMSDFNSVCGDLQAWLLGESEELSEPSRQLPPSRFWPTDSTWSACASDTYVDEMPVLVSLTSQLTNAVRGAAEGIGCDAVALYVLDDATTELTMRAMWGLSPARLMDEPRPLHDSLADLEAMCGHAVVLEDELMHEIWRVPEPCESAVCIPVASNATILGTLWFFCNAPRTFDDHTTNLMETVAGGLAAELALEQLQDDHRLGHIRDQEVL